LFVFAKPGYSPFPEQSVNLGGAQGVGQSLHCLGVLAGKYAVVQGLELYTVICELTLQVFVAVDVEFGVVREVGTEFVTTQAYLG
jgi:hypothetical protein